MTRQHYKTLLSVLLLVAFATSAPAQDRHAKTPQTTLLNLQQDFTFFKTILSENYPSLYRYTGKAKLDRQFDSCYAAIGPQTTEIEFLKIIKLLFSAIKDGHLYCGPSPQLRQYMDEEAKLFPLKIQFIGNKAYLRASSGSDLPAGTEILSIDHKPVNEIKKELFRYMVSDGNIESKKYHILNYAFSSYYLMVFGERPDFAVTYKSNKVQKTIKVSAVRRKDIPKDAESNGLQDLLKLTFKDSIALLTIKTFDSVALKDAGNDYRAFLESSFKEINRRSIKKLVIDLRGNGGGRDLYGALLYAYLADKKFAYYKQLTAATTKLPYEQFRSNNSSYNNLDSTMLDSVDAHSFRLKNIAHPGLGVLEPNKTRYSGKVWFLIDGLSFSATAEFCAVARGNRRGKFIGQETGGGYEGNTSMQIDTTLPNTKTAISFGMIKYEMAVTKARYKGRGVIPNYIITPTISDIINKKDPQLDFAMTLAHSIR